MALNAFWGSKKVFVVNETGCQLAKEIVKELREANFNAAEEVSSFDYAGFVVGEAPREAFLLGKGKQAAVLAGAPFFTEVFAQVGCE